jgi:hypothetical protein
MYWEQTRTIWEGALLYTREDRGVAVGPMVK